MTYDIRELEQEYWPKLLFQIEDPPEKLFVAGGLPDRDSLYICVVGSRKYSEYGKEACRKIISGLAGQNIVIVSGLALGIDSIAHEAALEVGLKTIAVPGSGLDPSVLYPRTNVRLAERIIENGGALLSEFEEKFRATPYSFPQRNRIMAGMSDATIIVEAGEKSGTLITARLGMEYNRDVFVVPGDIFSQSAVGSNKLIKDGATPVFGSNDILEHFGLNSENKTGELFKDLSRDEQKIIELLSSPITKDELIEKSGLGTSKANILISSMEIKGLIKEVYGKLTINS